MGHKSGKSRNVSKANKISLISSYNLLFDLLQSVPVDRYKSLSLVTAFSEEQLRNHLSEILHVPISARCSACDKFLKLYQAFF